MNRPHFRRRGRAWRLRPADPEWPDVIAAETPTPLVDLPADQSGFTALADWPVWDYGEGYEIGPWPGVIEPEYAPRYVMGASSPEPAESHGRHRQTDPADLLLADLRDIEDRLS